jgi:hypothetical protein
MRKVFFIGLCLIGKRVAAEKQRDAPKRGEADKRVYHSADCRRLSAADPCDDIEFEQADAAPVDAADYGQNKCDAVDYHLQTLLSHSVFPIGKELFTKIFPFDKSSAFSLFTRPHRRCII